MQADGISLCRGIRWWDKRGIFVCFVSIFV